MFTKESSYEALSKLSKVQCVHFCVHVAKSVLHVWEERFPDDLRSRKAIEAAEYWLINQNSAAARAAWTSARAAGADAAAASAAAAAAASAAYAARAARASVNAADAAAWAAVRAGQNWQWIGKLYSSIYKEQPFLQSWKTRDTLSIAKDMLSSRCFKDMPILADALEDAGCQDHEILYHLRNDEGLWIPVDWVLVNLGK